MARNINKLMRDIIQYAKDFIIPEDDYISDITPYDDTRNLTHRGTGIYVFPKEPEDITKMRKENEETEKSEADLNDGKLAAIFYIEELLAEHPGATAATLAEIIRIQFREFYPSVIQATKNMISGSILKNLSEVQSDAELKKKIVLTSVPIRRIKWEDFASDGTHAMCVAQDESRGLNYMIKCDISGAFGEDTEADKDKGTRIGPVINDTGAVIPEIMWKKAWRHYLASMRLHFMAVPSVPWIIAVQDELNNGEFFYLLNTKNMINKIKENLPVEMYPDKVTIVPLNDFMCSVMIQNSMIRQMITGFTMAQQIVENAVKDALKDVPIYDYNIADETFQIATEFCGVALPQCSDIKPEQLRKE